MAVALPSADLSDANLEGTDLASADLSGAILRGARAAGTDFTGAKVDRAVGLESVRCNETTHPPTGWHCKAGTLSAIENDSNHSQPTAKPTENEEP